MIRPYRPADLPVIMDIGNRAWQPIFDMYQRIRGAELFALLTPDRHTVKGEQVKAHAERSPQTLLVCEEAGRIVGFITFHLDRDKGIGTIGNNAADPACGLKGIGQQMYQAAFARFRQEGMRFAKVTTGLDEAHAPARRAYERAGFNVRQEDVTYYMKL
jgi:ribosomal protein S18 acetylase RimI-like enzyme